MNKQRTPSETFLDLTINLNQLNQLFMFSINNELQNNGIYDISATQALTLVNIGENKKTISTVSKIGYYIGQNITYNIKALIGSGYIISEKYTNDKRRTYLIVTKKGIRILEIVNEMLCNHHDLLEENSVNDNLITKINDIIDKMQKVLGDNK